MSIFVFGSNLAGRHGAGAALTARHQHGAVYGVGIGPTGNAYAIPTKDHRLRTLLLPAIGVHVRDFITYAKANPQLTFEVTRIGCGLAGYRDLDIAPLFCGAPHNCRLPPGWRKLVEDMREVAQSLASGLNPELAASTNPVVQRFMKRLKEIT